MGRSQRAVRRRYNQLAACEIGCLVFIPAVLGFVGGGIRAGSRQQSNLLAFNRIASQDALSAALGLQAAGDPPSALRYPPKSWRLRAHPCSERHY
jgi:hypothetical protein